MTSFNTLSSRLFAATASICVSALFLATAIAPVTTSVIDIGVVA